MTTPSEPEHGSQDTHAAAGPRYAALAAQLLAAPDPVTALAHHLADHEARLDAICRRLQADEAQTSYLKTRIGP